MAANKTPAERFAAATDAMIEGAGGADESTAGDVPELAIAARLRAQAPAGVPDPVFVDGLRAELRLLAGAPPATQPGAGLRYTTIETPVGHLAIAYRNGRVVYCAAVDAGERAAQIRGDTRGAPAAIGAFERDVARSLGALPQREQVPPPALERAVRDHLAGRKRFAAVDLTWLKPFQRRVLEKTAEIPRGEVRPYGWIAREIGAPGAVRAVGTALGHNPIPFLIPCHRVVRSDGSLGEYSGGGPAVKERVLAFEGAPLPDVLAGPRYRGSRTTQIVCYPSCRAARRIRPEYAVPFASLAQAGQYGYRPCRLCRPV
jgi:methylated-DNA-[protein]-cysteine S-methyltransferase